MPIVDASHTYKPFLITRYPMRKWGNDSYTKLLLHCNGTDESTSFPDASASGHTVTANGDAQVDTAQKKFGTGSALVDGIGDYLSVPDSADWYMGTGAFTIDFWVRFNSVAANAGLCGQFTDTDNRATLTWTQGFNWLTFTIFDATIQTIFLNASWLPVIDTWYHIAVIRGWNGNANDWALTIDGIQIGSTLTDADPWPDFVAGSFVVGRGFSSYHNGWIDEFRVSKGIARWTANFTPPTAQYR